MHHIIQDSSWVQTRDVIFNLGLTMLSQGNINFILALLTHKFVLLKKQGLKSLSYATCRKMMALCFQWYHSIFLYLSNYGINFFYASFSKMQHLHDLCQIQNISITCKLYKTKLACDNERILILKSHNFSLKQLKGSLH